MVLMSPENLEITKSLKRMTTALAGWLSWLELRPDTARLQVRSPVRAHTRVNQWMHQEVQQQIDVSLSLPLSPLSL